MASLLARMRGDMRRARQAQAELAAELEANDLKGFLDALPVREPREGAIMFARVATPNGTVWAGREAADLHGQHFAATGGTGVGKSAFAYGQCGQFLRAGWALFSIDLKGEISAILRDSAPKLAPGLPMRTLRPFGDAVPPLRLTQREDESIPVQAQALSIARDICEILGEALSLPQQRVLVNAIALAIELDAKTKQVPLPAVVDWLDNPLAFARAAKASTDPGLRAFATHLAASNGRISGTLAALAARLDVLLFLPQTRAAFSAPSCLRFADCFDSGVTILDCTTPAGCEEAGRIIAALLLGRAIRAALSRPPGSKPAVLFLDEVQEVVRGRHQRDAFSRALALARWRGLNVVCTFQGAAQIDRALVEIIRTNCSEAAFRMNPEDARAYLHALPLPHGSSPTEARRVLMKTLTSLPRRHFVCWPKFAGVGAAIVQSPRIDFAALRTPLLANAADVRNMAPDAAPATNAEPIYIPNDRPPLLGVAEELPVEDDTDDAPTLHLG